MDNRYSPGALGMAQAKSDIRPVEDPGLAQGLEVLRNAIAESEMTIREIDLRLFGPSPTSATTGAEAPVECCADSLARALRSASDVNDSLRHILSRL